LNAGFVDWVSSFPYETAITGLPFPSHSDVLERTSKISQNKYCTSKKDYFSGFFTRDPQKLEDRIVKGLQSFFENPDTVASHGSIWVNF
jgi:hypothetical protein